MDVRLQALEEVSRVLADLAERIGREQVIDEL